MKNKEQERYPMCKDQPVQLDCRMTECKFHEHYKCVNTAPALTLIDGYVRCWSSDVEPVKPIKELEKATKKAVFALLVASLVLILSIILSVVFAQ